jgi:DNA-binding NarL/FixJ family response regulator
MINYAGDCAGYPNEYSTCNSLRSTALATVLVVEDEMHMCDFFAASVSYCKELSLLASVGTVAAAKHWLNSTSHTVDVLLVDLGLPDGSGLEVIRHAIACNPSCEPLVISMFGDEANILASIESGALGYIHKDSAPDNIANTILEMRSGASPISPMIARRVLNKYRSAYTGALPIALMPPAAAAIAIEIEVVSHFERKPKPGFLSPREQDVLALIARGYSYAEVARLEGLSVRTVQTHIKSLYGKLSVHSKTEAVFEGSRMGLL